MSGVPYWVEICGYIVAAAAGGGAAWKVVKWLWSTVRSITKLSDDLSAFTEVMPVILSIAHEFKNNNGSSLRDVIDRIEEKTDAQARESKAIREMTEAQTSILNRLPCKPDDSNGCQIRT